MKVVFCTTNRSVPFGGSEVLWSQAALHLASCVEHSVAALVPKWTPRPSHVRHLAKAGVRLFEYGHGDQARPLPRHKSLLNRFLPSRWQFSKGRGVSREFCDLLAGTWGRADVAVVSQGNHTEGMAAVPLLDYADRYVTLSQLVTFTCHPRDKALAGLREFYAGASLNCFVSQDNAEQACRSLGLDIPHRAVVHNPPGFRCEALPYPSCADGVRLACPARLDPPHKGQDILIDVMGQQKWRERSLRVDCYGEGDHRDVLDGRIRFQGATNVRLCGGGADIRSVWADHHCLVLPSRMEGQSLALVEAMMCGRPVVVTDVGGARELVQDGVNGFIAAAPTPALIDDALERAWERRSDWGEMGESSRRIIEEYLRDDPVESFCGLLRGITNG